MLFGSHRQSSSPLAWSASSTGRLYEGKTLVELGSEREAERLAMMRRAAELRRRWCGAAAEEDPSLSNIEEQIEGCLGRFRDAE